MIMYISSQQRLKLPTIIIIIINLISAEVCRLEPVAGPCRGTIPSYFFNSTSGRCGKFFYGGCGGNDNRFSLLEDCQESCGRERPTENPCFLIDCALGTTCRVNQGTGRGECVPRDEEPPTMNRCSYVLCQPGLECQINKETGAGECVFPGLPTSCSALSCVEGTACVVDLNTGAAKCVPTI